MKRSSVLAVAVAVTALFATSCIDNGDILYSETVIGNLRGGQFLTDAGLTYIFKEQACDGHIDTLSRIIAVCDVLEKTSETTYNARLRDFAPVAVRSPKLTSQSSDEELGTDAINLVQGWFSSDYLNVLYNIPMVPSSQTYHTIDLAFDDVRSSTDTLYFELRHNGFGEVYDNPEYTGKTALASGYISFPISQYVPGGKSEIPVVLTWDWYVQSGESLLTEKEHHRETAVYSKQ